MYSNIGRTSVHFLILFILQVYPVDQTRAQDKNLTGLQTMSESFEKLAELVTPAVVQIIATGYVPGDASGTSSLISKQRGSGSGVLLNSDGYIVTNAHVIRDSRDVKVRFSRRLNVQFEGKSILQSSGKWHDAKIIGTDTETDLAVLKIDRTGLHFLSFGDSDAVRKGQLVFAFGSPFGLENSVTMGVVSAAARQLQPEDPMIYIQTDTPINPGNSGGPLVNSKGEVVGINTFILSRSGGSEGIGFAAPSNIVKNVFEQLKRYGRVRRGIIGVRVQTISLVLAAGLDLSQDYGVLVSDVYPFSPAFKEGVKIADIILALDDKVMENGRQFEVNLYNRRVSDIVKLDVLRGDERKTLCVSVVEREDDVNRFAELVDPEKNLIPRLGIMAIDLDDGIKKMLPPLRGQHGILVAARSKNFSFLYDNLQAGDIIYSINRIPIQDIGFLKAELKKFTTGDILVFQVERNRQLIFVAFELE